MLLQGGVGTHKWQPPQTAMLLWDQLRGKRRWLLKQKPEQWWTGQVCHAKEPGLFFENARELVAPINLKEEEKRKC